MSQNSQDAIDVLSKVIVDTIEKKLNDAKFDKSQTGVVTAVSGNTYTISVFGSQYNITSDQIYTVGQSVVVTALQGDMKRLVCSPDNIGTMKTVDSKVNVVGSQLSIIDTDFADTIVKYTDVSEFLTLKDQADGQLSLWFYSGVPSTDTAPTVNWVTEDAKRVHIGDLYYDMKADDAYRWTDTFIWETLSDKNLLKVLRAASLETDTANGSRRVFFTKPSTPYNRGDVWASSSGDNKVLVCQTARPITESFSRTDWAVALKYTDDTKANEALDAAGKIDGDLVSFKTEYNSDLESTKQQIEARVTTKKYNEDMSGLNTKISLAESRISKNENAIILCATKTEAQKYSHPTSSGNKHIPSGGSAGQILRWSKDGEAQWGADNNTTYSAFKGATSAAAGGSGLVPAPAANNAGQFLKGDGTWATPLNTTYNNATSGSAGLMSAGDKAKLDGIAANANNYTHPTSAGNKHIPAGGQSGQILRWSGDGSATWGPDYNTTYSDFKAATASVAGGSGLVPAPAAGKQGQYLRGDGTWATPTNTTYSDATQSAHGLMSTADKKKLDGFGAASTYALKSDITAMYRYKGSVTSTDKLPTSGQTIGDVYDVGNGMNYAWNGSAWDALGEIFTITKITNTEIDTVLAS